MRVLMTPHLDDFKTEQSGIRRVVEAYFKYLPDFGVELVPADSQDYDLLASHAGSTGRYCDVAHCHGLYWTADYQAPLWEYDINRRVIDAVRHARLVTVPSAWVALAFQRDMRFTPEVIPHGIDWQDWQHSEESQPYVLWNKNRQDGVCDPTPLVELAKRRPDMGFLTTFIPRATPRPENVKVSGIVDHETMRVMIQQCGVYLASTKETFGIGILEAMASGKPVLSFAWGGALGLVQHGVSGYLAAPNDYDDLAAGLDYCCQYRDVLGANGRELARAYTWPAACEQVAVLYRRALEPEPQTVSIVIPCFNKAETIERAVGAALAQDWPQVSEVIVVDDGSTDGSLTRLDGWTDKRLTTIQQTNRGVAHARNAGIERATGRYIACLDGDDWIEPNFVSTCLKPLQDDRSLGIAYTGLRWHKPDGTTGLSEWPPDFDYRKQLAKQNQVPTCCLFRRDMWQRLGGYRQRYAPGGAGSEDAEFWLRAGAYGWGARKVTPDALFHYSWLSGQVTGDKGYQEVDWTLWHPWTKQVPPGYHPGHPFASLAPADHFSHPVREYDEPLVSVVIPVGPGHEKELLNALDSLEAQTFRQWEAVVAWDAGTDERKDFYRTAYPYLTWVETKGKQGPGVARNLAAAQARGQFVVCLDADDWLYPQALEAMLEAWRREHAIVYTDYVGKALIEDEEFLKTAQREGRLRARLKGNEVVLGHQAAEFDCERAMQQPERPPFVWCNVTALVPRAWHLEIGGFDEKLPSWEDVDYHWRMARAGHCYVRVPQELMVYRFYSGGRRDAGFDMRHDLIRYLERKYKKDGKDGKDVMGCSGCGRKKAPTRVPVTQDNSAPAGRSSAASGASPVSMAGRTEDSKVVLLNRAIGKPLEAKEVDIVKAEYTSRNHGDHRVIGPVTRVDYGYHKGGDVFLIHHDDLGSGWFREVYQAAPIAVPPVKAEAAPPLPLPPQASAAPTRSAAPPAAAPSIPPRPTPPPPPSVAPVAPASVKPPVTPPAKTEPTVITQVVHRGRSRKAGK